MWGIEGLALGDLTAGALVGAAVLLVFLGLLVPRRTLKDTQAERDSWRHAHSISEEARGSGAAQTTRLLELAETNARLLEELRDAARHAARPGASSINKEDGG